MKVRKRDGRVVNFDRARIKNAVLKAIRATVVERTKKQAELADEISLRVTKDLERLNQPIVDIEQIQDLVEFHLMSDGYYRVAKNYIVYREKRRVSREMNSFFRHLKSYVDRSDEDAVRQNANVSYSYPALRNHLAGEVIKKWALEEMYPKEVARAHREGFIHIHDLDFANAVYCVGHDLRKLILMGFSGPEEHVASGPAKHLSALTGQMVNYLGVLQNEAAGAQAFNSVDTLLAPYVRKERLSYDEVKQCIQQLVYGVNVTSRWGQSPFVNFTFDFEPPYDLKDQNCLWAGKTLDFTYGELRKEMEMINRAFWEIMLEGDYQGKVFTFPIPTINITKDFDWSRKDVQLMLEATAKYGIPYFANFVSSWLDPRAVRSMCCRLSLDLEEVKNYTGGLFGAADSTGSIGVVTLNLPRIAYIAKKSDSLDRIEKFFELLEFYLEVAKTSLEIKRKVITQNFERGLFPYLKKYLPRGFMTFFSTIGIVGGHEMCLNLLGKGIETPEGRDFAKRVLEFIVEKTRQFQKETDNLYNFEATPAEMTAYRFAKIDVEEFGTDIAFSGPADAPYYTNSTHLPPGRVTDLVEVLEHQSELQPLYTSGTVLHIWLPDKFDSDSTRVVIDFVCQNSKVPYFSITPTYSICPDHGYIAGEVYSCPKCSKETLVYSRITGYYRPVHVWNKGKQSEWKDREYFKISK